MKKPTYTYDFFWDFHDWGWGRSRFPRVGIDYWSVGPLHFVRAEVRS